MPRPYQRDPRATAFYVVANPATSQVKIGVTVNPRARLFNHHKQGFGIVLRLWAGLPEGNPSDIESAVLTYLENTGIEPVAGWEYFDNTHTDLILSQCDKEFKVTFVTREKPPRPRKSPNREAIEKLLAVEKPIARPPAKVKEMRPVKAPAVELTIESALTRADKIRVAIRESGKTDAADIAAWLQARGHRNMTCAGVSRFLLVESRRERT